MCSSIISGFLLNRAGMKLVFGFDKLVPTKGGDFIGHGYTCNPGLFVLDVTCEVANNVENASSLTYIDTSLDMWHARPGYLNLASI